jgi:putative oxidoreductase
MIHRLVHRCMTLCHAYYQSPSWWVSAGLLCIRLIVGIAFIYHGWGKLAKGATLWMGDMIPAWLQGVAAYSEFLSGVGLMVGCLHPLLCVAIIGAMIGAMVLVHLPLHHPFISVTGASSEAALVYLVIALGLLFTGPGGWSLDARLWPGVYGVYCTYLASSEHQDDAKAGRSNLS